MSALQTYIILASTPQKHYVKSQWIILDTSSLGTTPQQKTKDSAKMKREDKHLKTRTALLNVSLKFATDSLQTCLLECCTRLSEVIDPLTKVLLLASKHKYKVAQCFTERAMFRDWIRDKIQNEIRRIKIILRDIVPEYQNKQGEVFIIVEPTTVWEKRF